MSWFSKEYEASDLSDEAYEWIPEEVSEYDGVTYEALVAWRDHYAYVHSLSPDHVATNAHLKSVAATRPTDDEEFKEIGFDQARIQLLGGAMSAHVAAQQIDWQGVRVAKEPGLSDYEVPGEDRNKDIPEDFLAEIDTLDEKL